MSYADTDFFLALLKPRDWLKKGAEQLLAEHRDTLWTGPATLIELMLVGKRVGLDVERLVFDAMQIAECRFSNPGHFLVAAHYVEHDDVNVFDAVHAAFCGTEDAIISSDKVFDRLGLQRIPLQGSDTREAA